MGQCRESCDHEDHKEPHSLLLCGRRTILRVSAERFVFDPLEFFLRFVLLQLWKHSDAPSQIFSSTSGAKIQCVEFDFFLFKKSNEGVKGIRGAFVVTAVFMAVEGLIGWTSGSLVLVADASHMLADAAGLGLAAVAGWIATRRAEGIGALLSGTLVFGAVATLVSESVDRFGHSSEIRTPGLVLATAVLGLLVNVLVLRVLDRDHDHTEHVHHQAARLHVLADLAGSLVAIASTAMVIWGGWVWIDPIATLGISALVATAGVRLMRDALRLLRAQS